MREKYTDITIVLDRSGSMDAVVDDTIGGFNRFLSDQREVDGKATITLYQFDHEYETVYEGIDIKEAKHLSKDRYEPRGMTALLDAIGMSIRKTGERLRDMPETERPSKVIFVILTDGYENSSKEFTNTKISEMISHQQSLYSWEFVFLGANQDAIASAATFGIGAQHSMTYASNSQGVTSAFASVSANMANLRLGNKESMHFTDKDRAEQKEAGVTN